jgi:hypothetical protein
MEESTPPAKKQFPRSYQPGRFYRTNLNGPLKITKADGTVEIKPAMTAEELIVFLDQYPNCD